MNKILEALKEHKRVFEENPTEGNRIAYFIALKNVLMIMKIDN